MRKIFFKIYRFLLRINYGLFFLIQFTLSFALPNLVNVSLYYLAPEYYKGYQASVLGIVENSSIVAIVVIAPIVETIIFQFLLYKFCKLLQIKSVLNSVLLASSIFAIAHFSHPFYIIIVFFSGIVYNYTYIISMKRYNVAIAIFFTALLHSIDNLISVVWNNLLN